MRATRTMETMNYRGDNELLETVEFAIPIFHCYGHEGHCQVKLFSLVLRTVTSCFFCKSFFIGNGRFCISLYIQYVEFLPITHYCLLSTFAGSSDYTLGKL